MNNNKFTTHSTGKTLRNDFTPHPILYDHGRPGMGRRIGHAQALRFAAIRLFTVGKRCFFSQKSDDGK